MSSNVKLRCFKSWCHKSYRSRDGSHYATYTRVPTQPMQFVSPMHNDENQELCGGWTPDWVRDYPGGELVATIDRVVLNTKPMGFVWAWPEHSKDFHLRIRSSFKFYSRTHRDERDILHAAVWNSDKRLESMFDLDTLAADYETHVGKEAANQIRAAGKSRLQDYVKRWYADEYSISRCITGLILGYPIENTISLYRGGIKTK